jgi:hypothetical protein
VAHALRLEPRCELVSFPLRVADMV